MRNFYHSNGNIIMNMSFMYVIYVFMYISSDGFENFVFTEI